MGALSTTPTLVLMKLLCTLSIALLLLVTVLGEEAYYSGHNAPVWPERFHTEFLVSELNCKDTKSMRVMARGQYFYDAKKNRTAYLVDSVPEHGRFRTVFYKGTYYMIDEGTGKCRSFDVPNVDHPVQPDFLRKYKYLRTSWMNRDLSFVKGEEWIYDPH